MKLFWSTNFRHFLRVKIGKTRFVIEFQGIVEPVQRSYGSRNVVGA